MTVPHNVTNYLDNSTDLTVIITKNALFLRRNPFLIPRNHCYWQITGNIPRSDEDAEYSFHFESDFTEHLVKSPAFMGE